MNPCENCPLDKLGCHDDGKDSFADNRCQAWVTWKTELLLYIAELKHRNRERGKIPLPNITIMKGG